ncbi:hypothetical protein YTPLAS18_24300 [Nitrospira sp.]|nr:hypothetical protein YTPLAS18_24300 [Nitrospira sp.]
MVKELARRGHVIDEYIIRIGEPNDAHWPLTPFVRERYRHIVPRSGNRLRPYLAHVWASLVQDTLKSRTFNKVLRSLGSSMSTRGYDVVHVDHCSPSYTVPLVAMVAIPTVLYSHEVSGARYDRVSPSDNNDDRSLYRRACDLATDLWAGKRERIDRWGVARADLVMTNSYYSKEAMFQRVRRNCVVCRYGVDIETFRPLGLRREPIVLSAGRLVEAKQHHLVIDAVSKIPVSRRPRVVIATPEALTHQEDPAYAERVIGMAKERDVTLEVRRNPTEGGLVEMYNRALMLAFVPVMEPFGLVALEAMACGTPVVGIREGGVRESVVDGRTGRLVDRIPDDVAGAIDALVQHDELRERYGAAAADYVRQEWSWSRCIDRYESEVARLLAMHG